MVEIIDDVEAIASDMGGAIDPRLLDSGAEEDINNQTSLTGELRQATRTGQNQMSPNGTASQQDEDAIPYNIQEYLAKHQIDGAVNSIVNKVVKDRPADPLSTIAQMLLTQSRKSFPTFDKLTARRIFVADNPQCETLKISVFLNYQGRSALRYRHTFAFDTEEQSWFLFDDQTAKAGLTQAVSMICNEITETLRVNLGSDPLTLDAFRKIDGCLLQFFDKNLSAPEGDAEAPVEEVKATGKPGARPTSSESVKTNSAVRSQKGMAFIKACSEALFLGVAHCIKRESTLATSIRENMHPLGQYNYMSNNDTKLLVNILTGGKEVSSPVKFANFYLIIDGHVKQGIDIAKCFKAFLTQLRTRFTSGKGGDSAFKLLPEGAFINAFPSIADSFKFIEEAIQASNANQGRPGTNHGGTTTGRAGTALSGDSKSKRTATVDATLEGQSEAQPFQATNNTFQIGINCDATNLFNKDPKDPNKYEIEGNKTQSTQQQLIEYYVKLLQDHPFVTYIEDPLSEADIPGYRKLKEALLEAGLGHVKIGMKHIFRDSNLLRVKDVTTVRPLTAEEQQEENAAKEEEKNRPPTSDEPAKKGGKGAAKAEMTASELNRYKGPNHEKFTPDCVSIRTSPLSTVSDLLDFWRYMGQMDDEKRFSMILDDQVNQEVTSEADCYNVDLGVGLGCGFIHLRGCAKPERFAKIAHYASQCQ